MEHLAYSELAPWYHLLDARENHADEVEVYDAQLEAAIDGRFDTLLELGAGAGNNAYYFKQKRSCVLTDLAPQMVELAKKQNPECEHHVGDMRTLRLGRTFDAVMVHDACVYMLTEEDVRRMADTAFAHLRPGGAALFAPDCITESFREFGEDDARSDGTKSLRYVAECWQPVPGACTYRVDYAFLLREGNTIRAVHDVHEEGLFSTEAWTRILSDAGFVVDTVPRNLGEAAEYSGYCDYIFRGRRPL